MTLQQQETKLKILVKEVQNAKKIEHLSISKPEAEAEPKPEPKINQNGGSNKGSVQSLTQNPSQSKKEVEKIIPQEVKKLSKFKKLKMFSLTLLFLVSIAFFVIKYFFPFHAEYIKNYVLNNPEMRDEVIGKNANTKLVAKLFKESSAKFLRLEETKDNVMKYLSKFSLVSINSKIVGNIPEIPEKPIDVKVQVSNMLKSFFNILGKLGITTTAGVASVATPILKKLPFFAMGMLRMTIEEVSDVTWFAAKKGGIGTWFVLKNGTIVGMQIFRYFISLALQMILYNDRMRATENYRQLMMRDFGRF